MWSINSIFLSVITFIVLSHSSCDFRFGSITLLTGERKRITVAAGFNMAVDDYRTDSIYNIDTFISNILSLDNESCTITQNMADMQSDIKIGIVEAFELGQTFGSDSSSDDYINIPIIVGPPTSGYSLTLNPLISAFDLLQFSSTATSTFLADYHQFFRSIPSDDLQANALVKLCEYFGWENIGIMYMNTNYGSSLQQAITSYAKNSGIASTTFSYIDGDNITMADAVESMKQSGIYINILISYGSDLEFITAQIKKHEMVGYPYYFLGTDSWLGTIGEDATIIDIYSGVIGTCPWSPSLNDSFADKYPYPINESIEMFTQFNERWHEYYLQNRTDLLYGYEEPGFFTGYAYDNILTVIKSIDEYVKRYIGTQFHEDFWNNSNITARFEEILHEIWFVGMTGNVSYDDNGDRANGLFSFCNVDPNTGDANAIGYVIDTDNDLIIEIDESKITWPADYVERGIIPPQYEYIVYNGVPQYLIIGIFSISSVSIIFSLILMICLFVYRNRPIIKSSQWKLSCIQCIGAIVAYITIITFGVDESFDNKPNWSFLCNFRVVLLNMSFGLAFGPLFCKVYRIRVIFTIAKQLKKVNLTDAKMTVYNLVYVFIDFVICLILIITAPYNRIYRESDSYDIEREFYGSCASEYDFVYLILLVIPKIILSIYCMIISISVYSTVSMMKFNEGLQVLMTVVISVILIIIVVITLSVMTINSQSSAMFFYGFVSLIILMVCNFALIMMILPRLVAIWRGYEEEYEEKNKNIENRVNKYLSRLKTFRRRRTGSGVPSIEHNSSTDRHRAESGISGVGHDDQDNELNVFTSPKTQSFNSGMETPTSPNNNDY